MGREGFAGGCELMKVFDFYRALPSAIIDSFDRANSTNSIGNTETGQTWINGAGVGNNLGISSNAVYSASAVDAAAAVECGSPNGTLTEVIGTTADFVGCMFRYSDNNNYCLVTYYVGAARLAVEGKSSGSAFGGAATAGYYVSGSLANGDTLKVTLSGTSVTIYVNGVSKGTLTITQNASNTKHGVKLNGTTARVSSFRFDF